MMRKTIKRKLVKATINAFTLKMSDGKPEVTTLDPVSVWGKATEADARKILREKYGKEVNAVVGKIEYEDVVFEINIDTFVANAAIVEDSENMEDDE